MQHRRRECGLRYWLSDGAHELHHLITAASREKLCNLCRSWVSRNGHLEMLSCQDHDVDGLLLQLDNEILIKASSQALVSTNEADRKWSVGGRYGFCKKARALWPPPSLLSLAACGWAPLALSCCGRLHS